MKKKYSFNKYVDIERWSSYWHQIDEILKYEPESVLEIGAGNGAVANYIKNNTEIKYTTLDIDSTLNPDIEGNIECLKIGDNRYDIICAFEVLEHLPFEKFNKCLEQLRIVCDKYVIISLPHWGRHFSLDVKLPYFKQIKFNYKLNLFPIKHKFDGEHYWEIGKDGYPLKKIKEEIKNVGFKIINDYIVFESPYHHFFILKKYF
ncbi:MAG: methyltransferase domain-containing protein [bacterium]